MNRPGSSFSLLHDVIKPLMVITTHTTPALGFNRDGVVFFRGCIWGIMMPRNETRGTSLLYLGGACRCQRLGVLSRVIFSPLRSAWSMCIWSGNQDEAADPAKETEGAYRCQMVPNGATLVLLPPVTTGSEEDPGTPAGRLDPGSSPASRGNPGWDV